MNDECAIEARYVNHKNVQGRGVLQVILEIPVEHTVEFFNKFGHPDIGKEKRVGLALLSDAEVDVKREIAEKAGKEQRAFTELPYSQQAALLCKDPAFWRWLNDVTIYPCYTEDETKRSLRDHLNINSRSDLDDVKNIRARTEFKHLRDEFRAATKSYPEQRG